MSIKRLFISLFVLFLALSPILNACSPKPAPTPMSPTPSVYPLPSAAPSAAPTARPSDTPAPTPTRPPLPPTVVSVKPDRGEEHLLAAPVTILFDQPMDPASTSLAFSIEPKVPGEVKVQGDKLIFSPTERLKRGAEYKVTLAAGAASAAGLKLPQPVSFKLVTAGFLQVTNTQPANNTDDVPVDATLLVAFNRPVVPLSPPAGAGGGRGGAAAPLVITPTLSGKGEWLTTSIYQFTPEKGLAASTAYTVVVPAGLEDTTGGLLTEPYTITFRTTDPTVTNWQHADPSYGRPLSLGSAPVENPLTVTFSMPMERASTEAAFSLADANGKRVAGLFTWAENDTQLGFKPARLLEFGMRYTATITTAAKPASGQGALRGPEKHVFTTVSLPAIAYTDPRDGVSKATPGGGVRFNFASPMNPASFVTGTVTILPKPTKVYTSYNEWDASLYVGFDKQPATAYTVTLSGKVADPYGNLLGQDYTVHFTTGDYPPYLQLSSAGYVGTYNAYTTTETLVTYRNVTTVTFTLYRVPDDDFIRLTGQDYWQTWDRYTPAEKNLVRQWTVATDAARNETGFVRARPFDCGLQTAGVPRSGIADCGLTESEIRNPKSEILQAGLFYLVVTSPNLTNSSRPPRQLIARTDLNVTLKSADSEALAWVTDLKTGQPVAGATVRFTDGDAIDVTAKTNADGVAKVTFAYTRRSWEPLLAFAAAAKEGFGVASSNWEEGINPWDFRVPGGVSSARYNGYVYTDRPIYRPGQTVYWKAILRRDDDAQYSLPAAGQPVTVTIRDEQGNKLLDEGMTLSAMGAVDGKLALGSEAGLGYYYISVQLVEPADDENERTSFGVGFQVAEYRKPEYEISAKTERDEYIQGEQIVVTVQANYFFGGPVKNGKVSWVALAGDYSFYYAGKDEAIKKGHWSFGDWDWFDFGNRRPFGGALGQGEGVTDAQGRFRFTVPADVSKFTQSQRFTFDITILDVNNQAVSTQAYAVVHKGAFYIGLRSQRYVIAVGQTSKVDVLTVDPQSQPVPKTDVTLVVNRYNWYSVREQAEDGRFYWTSKVEMTPVYTQTLATDANGLATLEWTPKEGGEYKIEATGRDKAGHTIRSAAFVWVSSRDYVNWRQENNDRIELVADRDEYTVGDTAEILVASPYQTPAPGTAGHTIKALLTIERNHVLSYKVIEIKGNSELIRLPIEAAHAPNIFVSLILMKGMDETSPAPSFKMGLKQLKVSVADKELKIVLTPRRSPPAGAGGDPGGVRVFAPREKVIWQVQTFNAAGKPVAAEVSLALVDKAILTLADDQAGKLMDRFYSQRSLGVRTAATLVVNVDRLVAQLIKDAKGGGGGGGPEGPSVRREFPDIAYWKATVTTGADGVAEVEVTLPDNLTTWTMDARAITADTLVGQAKADIIATKDLLVRPVLPRFFIVGDQAEIAAVIHNNTKAEVEVEVKLAATGLTVPGASGSARHVVPAQGNVKIAWPVTVQPNVEQVKVTMSGQAQGRPLQDAVEMTLPVYRYTTPEVAGTSGQVALDEGRLELVRLPADADPTRGDLEVTLAGSLAAGMTGGLKYLEHYPYECVEQTMSRFLPNVVSYAALKKLGVKRPDLETVLPQQVGVGLQRIYARQGVDGGWGWWPNDESSLAVSAYVVFGLAKAKQAGFLVDKNVLDRGVKFLRSNLGTSTKTSDATQWQLNTQAFIVYALAEAGDKQPNRAGALYEQREKLSLFAKGYLALALGLINDGASADRIKTLLADLSSKAIVSATAAHWEEGWVDYWNMNSDTRTTSIALAALARLDPKNSLGPATVRWLMQARKADRWETTQENAWAIMALTDWMLATGELEGDYSWQVLLNDVVLGKGAVTPATVGDPTTLRADVGAGLDTRSGAPASSPGNPPLLAGQTNGLVIQRSATAGQTGKGQLYYTAYLKTYLPVEKLGPVNHGVIISREYRLADCGLPSQQTSKPASQQTSQCPVITQARVGDVITVKLSIVAPHDLTYLIVEDPLPAGAEAIDTSLHTTSQTVQGPDMQKVKPNGNKTQNNPWWWDWWWRPTHTELRDEKAAMFSTWLGPGSYEFTYQIRASLPGKFQTLPPTAYQMYFPEVWGRGAGSLFTITQ
jgi:uncharacterized protein YfaS (alpha-2-macroglobulin family)